MFLFFLFCIGAGGGWDWVRGVNEMIADLFVVGDLEREKSRARLRVRLEGVRLVFWGWRLWGGRLGVWVLWGRLLGRCENAMELKSSSQLSVMNIAHPMLRRSVGEILVGGFLNKVHSTPYLEAKINGEEMEQKEM